MKTIVKSVAIIGLLGTACFHPEEDHGGHGGHGGDGEDSNQVEVVMTSSQLSSVVAVGQQKMGARFTPNELNTEECELPFLNTSQSASPNRIGECITPLDINGYVQGGDFAHNDYIEAANDDPWAAGQAQIFSLDGTDEEGHWVQSAAYRFQSATAFSGGVSATNTPDINWSDVSTQFESMNVQFQMGAEFWTLRYNFVTFPLTADTTISACVTDQHLLNEMNEESTARPSVQRNDVQLCVRDDNTTCSDSEFKWLDLDSGEFVTTRPTNPHQVSAADAAFCETSDSERSGYSIGFGGFAMDAGIVDSLGSDVSINYWAQDTETPYKQFFYIGHDGSSGQGNSPKVTLDYDVTNSVFIDADKIADDANIEDWETADSATIFKNTYLKPVYLEHLTKTQSGLSYEDSGMSVQVEIGFNPDIEWTPPDDDGTPEE